MVYFNPPERPRADGSRQRKPGPDKLFKNEVRHLGNFITSCSVRREDIHAIAERKDNHPKKASPNKWTSLSDEAAASLLERVQPLCHGANLRRSRDYVVSSDINLLQWGVEPSPDDDPATKGPQSYVNRMDFHRSNESDSMRPKGNRRKVVALNCAHVQLNSCTEYAVQIAAVDVLTNEVLFHVASYSKKHLRYGLSEKIADKIFASLMSHLGVLMSDAGALNKLYDAIDENTILVMHGGYHFLRNLEIVHDRVIDTQILADEATLKAFDEWRPDYSLKTLAKDLADVDIPPLEWKVLYKGYEGNLVPDPFVPNGCLPPVTARAQLGYDCVEAARATREVLLKYMDKERLNTWLVKEKEALSNVY